MGWVGVFRGGVISKSNISLSIYASCESVMVLRDIWIWIPRKCVSGPRSRISKQRRTDKPYMSWHCSTGSALQGTTASEPTAKPR
jgi:hypothetical protein